MAEKVTSTTPALPSPDHGEQPLASFSRQDGGHRRSGTVLDRTEGQKLVPFSHQVGGHHGILFYDKHTVCKPAFQREVDNYRYLAPLLGDFMPTFKGVTMVIIEKNSKGQMTYSAVPTPSDNNVSGSTEFAGVEESASTELKSSLPLFPSSVPTENGVLELQDGISNIPANNNNSSQGSAGIEKKEPGRMEFESMLPLCQSASLIESGIPESASRTDSSANDNKVIAETKKGESGGVELELSPSLTATIENGPSQIREVNGSCGYKESFDASSLRSHPLPHLNNCKRVTDSSEDLSDTVSDTVFEDITNYSFEGHGRGLNPWSLRCHQATMSRHLSEHSVVGETPVKVHADYILLENIASNYQCPSIMDLKIGTRCYGDDLSEEKKLLNMARAADSTSSILGVRFGGMQVFQADKGRYVCCNKKYGNTLNEEHLRKEVSRFVYRKHSLRREILQAIVARVRKLRDCIALLDGCRFFACSVLIIYEGMDQGQDVQMKNGGQDATQSSGGVQDAIFSNDEGDVGTENGKVQMKGQGVQNSTLCTSGEVQGFAPCIGRGVHNTAPCTVRGVHNITRCNGDGVQKFTTCIGRGLQESTSCSNGGLRNCTHCNDRGVQDSVSCCSDGLENVIQCSGKGVQDAASCSGTGVKNDTPCSGYGVLGSGVGVNSDSSTKCNDREMPKVTSCSDEGKVQVKIIDFMHASSRELQREDGVIYEGVDQGFIYGLENVINLFLDVN